MAKDFRLSTGFFDSPKIKKLRRELGAEGVLSLLQLWAWATDNRPDGKLTGLNSEYIELVADWRGESGRFVNELVTNRLLDVNDALTDFNDVTNDSRLLYVLHDWAAHNTWVAGSTARGDKARFSRLADIYPELYEQLKKEGRNSITQEEFVERRVNGSLTPAPALKEKNIVGNGKHIPDLPLGSHHSEGKENPPRIVFNYELGILEGITSADRAAFRLLAPEVNLEREFLKFVDWARGPGEKKVRARQGKGRRGLKTTLNNWLTKQQRNIDYWKLKNSDKQGDEYYDNCEND